MDDWEEHRFDGKNREGMVSFADKREIWQPVIDDISKAIR